MTLFKNVITCAKDHIGVLAGAAYLGVGAFLFYITGKKKGNDKAFTNGLEIGMLCKEIEHECAKHVEESSETKAE